MARVDKLPLEAYYVIPARVAAVDLGAVRYLMAQGPDAGRRLGPAIRRLAEEAGFEAPPLEVQTGSPRRVLARVPDWLVPGQAPTNGVRLWTWRGVVVQGPKEAGFAGLQAWAERAGMHPLGVRHVVCLEGPLRRPRRAILRLPVEP